jgi:hypothetical protein
LERRFLEREGHIGRAWVFGEDFSLHTSCCRCSGPFMADFVAEVGDLKSVGSEGAGGSCYCRSPPMEQQLGRMRLTHVTLTQHTLRFVAAVWRRAWQDGAGSGR